MNRRHYCFLYEGQRCPQKTYVLEVLKPSAVRLQKFHLNSPMPAAPPQRLSSLADTRRPSRTPPSVSSSPTLPPQAPAAPSPTKRRPSSPRPSNAPSPVPRRHAPPP